MKQPKALCMAYKRLRCSFTLVGRCLWQFVHHLQQFPHYLRDILRYSRSFLRYVWLNLRSPLPSLRNPLPSLRNPLPESLHNPRPSLRSVTNILHDQMPFRRPLLGLKDFHGNVLRTYSSWRNFEYMLVSSQQESHEDKLHMMVHADEILMDESSLLDVIIPYVKGSNLDTALPTFYAIMQRRAHETRASGDRDWPDLVWYNGSNTQLVTTLGDMTVDMFTRVTNGECSDLEPDVEQAHILRILRNLCRAMPHTQSSVVLNRVWSLVDGARLSESSIVALVDMTVDWVVRNKTADTSYSLREAEELRVSGNLEKLFRTMSDTRSAGVFSRLCSLLDAEGRSRSPIIALGDMTVDICIRGTSSDGSSLPEAEQIRILKILDTLLGAMPRTQSGAAVYLRLCALADAAHRLSDDVRKRSAGMIVAYYPFFEHVIGDIRPMLLAISSFKIFDPDRFSWGVYQILEHSATLPQAKFDQIRHELQGAITVVAEYFGRPDAMILADLLTRAYSWDCFHLLSGACVKLAQADVGLFSPEIVDVLEQFSLLFPYSTGDRGDQGLRNNMKMLRELTGQPTQSEATSAADLPPASGTDS